MRSVAHDDHRPGVDRGARKTLDESRRLVAGIGRLVRVDQGRITTPASRRATRMASRISALVGRIHDEVHAGAFTFLDRGAGRLELAPSPAGGSAAAGADSRSVRNVAASTVMSAVTGAD